MSHQVPGDVFKIGVMQVMTKCCARSRNALNRDVELEIIKFVHFVLVPL
jgi:hypothetical protein